MTTTDEFTHDGSRTHSAGKVGIDIESGTRTAGKEACSSNHANGRISPAGDGGAQTGLENCDSTDSASTTNMVSTGPSYNFVQACCESDSILQSTAGRQVKVINITEQDDFTLSSTLATVTGHLNGPRDVLFFSAPCTGGSPWQRINLARSPNLLGRMRRHWALFRRLWKSFELAAIHAVARGAQVYVEWPRHCAYWKVPRVAKFLAQHSFEFSDFDGCMYGLVAEHGERKGHPIRKPWRIASVNSSLPKLLNLKCTGHLHAACQGPDTVRTQNYTIDIAKVIHRCDRESGTRTAEGGTETNIIDTSTK